MHIAIMGPVASKDAARLLESEDISALPRGYEGAPLMVTLIEELLRQGHQVSAFTTSSDMPLRANHVVIARGERFALHYIPARPKAWLPNGWRLGRIHDLFAFERKGLKKAVLNAKPDVVHAHWAYEFAWAALATKIPHVITSHDSPFLIAGMYRDKAFKYRAYRWVRAWMAWWVLRNSKRITSVSPYMLDELSGLCGVEPVLVPNPVSEHILSIQPAQQAGAQRILMACNGWDSRKNPEVGLRAFSILSKYMPCAEIHLFGHGFAPGQEAERWWLKRGLVGNVYFRGVVSNSDLVQEMSASNVILHCSREESFGMVLAEAMAVGCVPVAGISSGAVPWVVGDCGRLVDVESAEVVAQALFELLSSPDEIARRRDRGMQHVRQSFSAASVVAAYERMYLEAVSERQV